MSMFTIDSKDIFDLFLYNLQSHFNSICLSHGMHLIGVQSVDVQDLGKNQYSRSNGRIKNMQTGKIQQHFQSAEERRYPHSNSFYSTADQSNVNGGILLQ